MARQVAAFEHAAIKPLYLLNGGGAVALLAAFIGRIWTDDKPDPQIMGGMAGAIFYFVVGLVLAALTTFGAYLLQQFFFKGSGEGASNRYNTAGHCVRFQAWVFGVGSLVAFAFGCFTAIEAFTATIPVTQ